MVWLSLMLTAVSVFAVGRLAAPIDVSCTDGEQTAYIPLGLRRVWSVAAGALSLLTWVVPTWPVFIAAMAGHLGAMVCRNARIVWSSRRFHITGALGLEWTYEYAQLRGFSRGYPSAPFWEYIKKYDNTVILGVDAHEPAHLANTTLWETGKRNVLGMGYKLIDHLDLEV